MKSLRIRTSCAAVGALGLAFFIFAGAAGDAFGQAMRGLSGQMHGAGPDHAGGCPPGPFGDHWVHFQNNGYTDSYDSRVGTWAGKGQEKLVTAGCNCNGSSPGISLDNNAIIYGNASVTTAEADGHIVQQNNSVIWDHDEKSPPDPLKYGSPRFELHPISLPSWWTAPGDNKIHGTYGSKNGCYEITGNSFQAYNNAAVTFDAGEYHFQGLELRNNSKITINAPSDEPVTIYVTGTIVLENNSQMLPKIEFAGDATKLRFLINGTATVDLSNNVSFYGLIYAPNARIEIRNNDRIYGNLVGKEVYIWNNAALHYDRALGEMDFGDLFGAPIPPPETTNWHEIIK